MYYISLRLFLCGAFFFWWGLTTGCSWSVNLSLLWSLVLKPVLNDSSTASVSMHTVKLKHLADRIMTALWLQSFMVPTTGELTADSTTFRTCSWLGWAHSNPVAFDSASFVSLVGRASYSYTWLSFWSWEGVRVVREPLLFRLSLPPSPPLPLRDAGSTNGSEDSTGGVDGAAGGEKQQWTTFSLCSSSNRNTHTLTFLCHTPTQTPITQTHHIHPHKLPQSLITS